MTKEIALKNPTFDFSKVSKDEKGKLICFQGQLSASRKRVAGELIKHGEILHGAQQVLADYHSGVFVAWLDSVGMTTSTAYNAISAYVGFGSFPNLENLEVSAMYALASNEKAKKKALKLADQGVKVTHAMARKLIADSAPKPEPEPEEGGDPFEDAEDPFEAPESPETPAEPEVDSESPQAPEARQEGKDRPVGANDYGKCPNCAGVKWDEDEEGVSCAKCYHPWGEPAGDVDEDRIKTQRSKTVKTAEALMRAFDDLNHLCPNAKHDGAIKSCKLLLRTAKEWR